MTAKKEWLWWTVCGKCSTNAEKDRVSVVTTIEHPTKEEREEMFWTEHKYRIHPSRCPKCQGK